MESKKELNSMRIGAVNQSFLNGEMILLVRFARELFSSSEDFPRLSSSFGLNWIGPGDQLQNRRSPRPIYFRSFDFITSKFRKFGSFF